MKDYIYLDYNSTTPVDPRVLEIMLPFFSTLYGNAASKHQFGIEINKAVKQARQQVAQLIRADTNEVVFTSGATEAINLAIKGVVENYQQKGRHIITVSTEHPAVLDTCRYLEKKGVEVTYLAVDQYGLIDLTAVEQAIREDTVLVSVMLVNNETGIVQPVREIAAIAHKKGALFMTDATQAVGKMPIDVYKMGIDLMAFSGHKFYGPKGVGGLYVNSQVKPTAIIHGGGHENGLRSGTLNVPGIIGLGKAAILANEEMESDRIKVRRLRDLLENSLLEIEHTQINGHRVKRLYNTTNVCFQGVDNQVLMLNLENICVSDGSACSSYSIEPSHVLLAMGLSKENATSSIRFSLGRFNTEKEINLTVLRIKEIVARLKAINIRSGGH